MFLATGTDIAKAVLTLIDSFGLHWTCGIRYSFDELRKHAKAPPDVTRARVIYRIMRAEPSLSSIIKTDQVGTNLRLRRRGFSYTRIPDEYWDSFAEASTKLSGEVEWTR